MLNKLIEGRYLNAPTFNNTPPPANTNLPQHFSLVTGRQYNIAESSGKYNPLSHTKSNVVAGPHASKAHRTFRWLPWIPGKISVTPLNGADVLTGPFSGCWVPIFTLNGTQYVGHIGTKDSPNDPLTVQVKAAWAAAKALPGFRLHASFNPARQAPDAWFTAATRNRQTMDILAAVSQNQVCQLVGLSPYLQAGPGEKKIVGSQQVQDSKATMPF